jgi:tyrosinase
MRFSDILLTAVTLGYASAQVTPVITRGATTGGVQPRKNLNDLCAVNGPERTLYFRAVKRMQDADMNTALSWFQVAAIHGRPFMNWVEDDHSRSGTDRGYCLHTDIGFLPWHRAYIALYEQSLVNYAIQIANEYPASVRSTYVAAAQRLRAPFWDWAADYNIPACAAASSISVYVPGGSSVVQQTMTNPLLSFRFPTGAASQFGQIVDPGLDTTRTVRCSGSEASAALAGDNLKDQVYSAFTRSTSFSALSAGTSNTVMPLEQPHNAVHVDAACGNHFSTVGAAGFDPLFMLNHANVDRLWAIWQEIYPTSIPSGSTTGGSWSIRANSAFTMTTPLSPFHTDEFWWTATGLRATSSLGYSIPGIDPTQSSSTRVANANALINRLYSPTGSGSGGVSPINNRRPVNPRRGTTKKVKRAGEEDQTTDKPTKGKSDDKDPKGTSDKDTKNSTAPPSNLDPSAPKRFFAKVTVDTSKLQDNMLPISLKFYIEGDLAGTFTLLNAPAGIIAKGEVPLHRALSTTGYEEKFTDDEMEDKIEEALKVVFLRPDDSVVDPASVAGSYTVEVESAELIPNVKITELPKYGKSNKRRIIPDVLHTYPDLLGGSRKRASRRI